MYMIPISAVPNQNVAVTINDVPIVISIRTFRGISYFSFHNENDSTYDVNGIRAVQFVNLLSSDLTRLLGGKLFLQTDNDEYPDYTKYGTVGNYLLFKEN